MSEYVSSFEQPLGEVIHEAYDRARAFIGTVIGRTEVEPLHDENWLLEANQNSNEAQQGPVQPPQQPPHVCGSVCSRCGKGGDQKPKPGMLKPREG